ncbi:putative serine/threonine protein kinase [Blattamonas nauphoetae]|uniref:non-specific serine/threonine protein kinase n=1 Tax=Blattamonas nauphoetae TaxID=2049346 RepID=A0ABQ9YLX2_9EUKA|nr:putative serine/threonine protein kinase [Blattamonas nauphoetae]
MQIESTFTISSYFHPYQINTSLHLLTVFTDVPVSREDDVKITLTFKDSITSLDPLQFTTTTLAPSDTHTTITFHKELFLSAGDTIEFIVNLRDRNDRSSFLPFARTGKLLSDKILPQSIPGLSVFASRITEFYDQSCDGQDSLEKCLPLNDEIQDAVIISIANITDTSGVYQAASSFTYSLNLTRSGRYRIHVSHLNTPFTHFLKNFGGEASPIVAVAPCIPISTAYSYVFPHWTYSIASKKMIDFDIDIRDCYNNKIPPPMELLEPPSFLPLSYIAAVNLEWKGLAIIAKALEANETFDNFEKDFSLTTGRVRFSAFTRLFPCCGTYVLNVSVNGQTLRFTDVENGNPSSFQTAVPPSTSSGSSSFFSEALDLPTFYVHSGAIEPSLSTFIFSSEYTIDSPIGGNQPDAAPIPFFGSVTSRDLSGRITECREDEKALFRVLIGGELCSIPTVTCSDTTGHMPNEEHNVYNLQIDGNIFTVAGVYGMRVYYDHTPLWTNSSILPYNGEEGQDHTLVVHPGSFLPSKSTLSVVTQNPPQPTTNSGYMFRSRKQVNATTESVIDIVAGNKIIVTATCRDVHGNSGCCTYSNKRSIFNTLSLPLDFIDKCKIASWCDSPPVSRFYFDYLDNEHQKTLNRCLLRSDHGNCLRSQPDANDTKPTLESVTTLEITCTEVGLMQLQTKLNGLSFDDVHIIRVMSSNPVPRLTTLETTRITPTLHPRTQFNITLEMRDTYSNVVTCTRMQILNETLGKTSINLFARLDTKANGRSPFIANRTSSWIPNVDRINVTHLFRSKCNTLDNLAFISSPYSFLSLLPVQENAKKADVIIDIEMNSILIGSATLSVDLTVPISSKGFIVGIVVGSLIVILLLAIFIMLFFKNKNKGHIEKQNEYVWVEESEEDEEEALTASADGHYQSSSKKSSMVSPRHPPSFSKKDKAPRLVYKPRKGLKLHNQIVFKADWQIPPEQIKLGQLIGRGASGEVFKAEWMGITVAVKRILKTGSVPLSQVKNSVNTYTPPFIRNPNHPHSQHNIPNGEPSQVENEVRLLMSLHHPNIIRFYGIVETQQHFGLVTEYADHGSFAHLLYSPSSPYMGAINMSSGVSRLTLALQAALGLNYLHSHPTPIIHRDVKLLNLLVGRNGSLKVGDLGCGKVMDQLGVAGQEGFSRVGTPLYAAPEVLRGESYDEKVDVYSFGVCLNEIWAREPPYSKSSQTTQQAHSQDDNNQDSIAYDPQHGQLPYAICQENYRPRIVEHTPPRLRQLIEQCWSGKPSERPSMGTVVKELRALVEDEEAAGEMMQEPEGSIGSVETYNTNSGLDAFGEASYGFMDRHFSSLSNCDQYPTGLDPQQSPFTDTTLFHH